MTSSTAPRTGDAKMAQTEGSREKTILMQRAADLQNTLAVSTAGR
jgi:hypothetical protein